MQKKIMKNLLFGKADTKILNKLPTYINMKDIINIETGIKTEILCKSVDKEKQNLCFSIITLERSYDFECSSEKIRDLLVDFINRKIKKNYSRERRNTVADLETYKKEDKKYNSYKIIKYFFILN